MSHANRAALPVPGVYLARVDRCDAGEDELGRYIDLRFLGARTGRFLCFDVLRFTPRATNIALRKLVQLGVVPGAKRLETGALVGRRAWLALYHEEFEGMVRAHVDIRRLRTGYLNEAEGPTDECECGGGRGWWRRRHSGLWICSTCCPPAAPAGEIDEIVVEEVPR